MLLLPQPDLLKPAHHGLGTGWHQDNAYFKLSDGKNGTAMWSAVHDATVHNGTLHVMAGMDNEVFPHVRDLTSDHHISCKASLKEEDAVALEVPAGGVIFFNCNVPHCTKANVTGNPRAAVAYHFVSKMLQPKDSSAFLRGLFILHQ